MTRQLVLAIALFGIALLAGVPFLGYWFWNRTQNATLREARAAYARGDWQAAARAARARSKSVPDDREAIRLHARATARAGRDKAALALYHRLGADGISAEDYYLIGQAALRTRQFDLGWSSLLAAERLDPRYGEALEALTLFQERAGRPLEAIAYAGRLAKLPGWEARGSLQLGLLRFRLDDPNAYQPLGIALTQDPVPVRADLTPVQVRLTFVRALLRAGRPKEAQAALAPVLADGPHAEASWLLSRAALQQNDEQGATKAITDAGDYATADPARPEPAPFVGSNRCASCHRDVFRNVQSSRHAQTLRASKLVDAADFPSGTVRDPRAPGVTHEWQRDAGRLVVKANVDARVYAALAEYIIGSGHQGATIVARDAHGQLREQRVSRFSDGRIWDCTIDHPDRPPDAIGYLGRPLSADQELKCLNCHATSGWAARTRSGAEYADRGIGCERCHGPGGNHLAAVELGLSDVAIARPQRTRGEHVVSACGECHRAPQSGVTEADPSFVRFQAPNLVRSRCFTESAGALSCITCHDPHQNAERSAHFYESKCLACHRSAEPAAEARGERTAARGVTCPVNARNDCLTCHMPRVADAVPHSVFTDHDIRVRRDAP